MKSLNINISLLWNINLDIPLLKNLEEGLQQRFEFLSIDGFVTVDVEQIEEVFDIVLSWLLPAYKIDEGLDYSGKFAFCESVVLVLVEFVEDLVEDDWDVLLPQLSLPHR